MEPVAPYNVRLALWGTPIQSNATLISRNIRVKSRGRKEPGEYTPLNIQPKSLNKISLAKTSDSRSNYSTRQPLLAHGHLDEPLDQHIVQQPIVKHRTSVDQAFSKPSRVELFRKLHQVKPKRCTCGDCEECLRDFNHFLQIFSTDESVPDISAKSWCIWRKNKNNKYMHYYGRRIHKVREIASLTKMVTAMTALDFLYKYDYDPKNITYEIRKPAVMVGGTSAQLQIGEIYTLEQLLYGLMLPSGNDAAIALSEAIGLLQNIKMRNRSVDPLQQRWYDAYLANNTKSFAYLFINMMGERCQRLGLLDTRIFNSHGNDAYDQLKNVSTCNQVAKISAEYLKYDLLRAIAQTKTYEVPRLHKKWDNTNKLLDDGFEGLKTGITDTAGPCLAANYKSLIVVVLSSKSMNERWIEVKKLVRWIVRKGL